MSFFHVVRSFLSRPVLAHRFQRLTLDIAPVPDSGSGPRKGGPRRTYQEIGQSSDIGTTNIHVRRRDRTSTV